MSDADENANIAAMTALLDRFRKKVLASPEYQAFKAMEEALAKVRAAQGIPPSKAASADDRPTSQGEAAYIAIKSEGLPLSIAELLERLAVMGVKVGGANPRINLSSTLSRDDRFTS